jgi:cholesterol transport system auxiliary component
LTAKTLFRAAASAALAVALTGCISLFPKQDPAQMYRLGAAAPAAAGAVAHEGEVLRGPITFERAAAGDRILTVNGTEAAYIAASRWVTPAQAMFQESMERAFAGTAGAPRLSSIGQGVAANALLAVDVEAFEARYEQGMEAAPTVVVRVRARLSGVRERRLLGEQVFEVRRPAAENRVSAIVAAFDAATAEALGGLVAWTAQAV